MESRCGLTRRRPCLSFSLAAKATGYVAAEPLRGDSAHPRVSVCRHPEDCRLSAERPLSSPSSGLPSLRASCSAPHPRLRAACILALLTALLTSPVARGAASANRAETSPSGQSRHPFLDEAREFEADAEWKPRGRAPLSVADVAEAAIQTLDRLTADLKHSPLAHDIDQDEEEKLDRVDTRLSEGDQMLKHIGCFRLAERHLAENRATYKDLLEKFSPQKGMRQDEMLRLMFHGAWVACYQTFETPDDVQRLTRGHLSPQEQLAALYRGPTTPLRFSKKQHSFAEQSIRKFATESPSSRVAINGVRGYVYAVVIVILLFLACMFVYRKWMKKRKCSVGNDRGRGRKTAPADQRSGSKTH
ncbi:hypothetical protein BESB_065800 [Besnoitia besnoiti]|uniref:Transmembrane protein n=1 Tax=Besnoitia besnoiti TaxID=94643 RepID=A0A2A9MG23_BESBE|nr:hypothetical protein BESB_065800 [Besnoitia besnoiti]PFH34547.1 hypothetical protein BESB_065800 [Besnoitia besnoiti]